MLSLVRAFKRASSPREDQETMHALYVHLILIMSCFASPEMLVENNDRDDRSIIRA